MINQQRIVVTHRKQKYDRMIINISYSSYCSCSFCWLFFYSYCDFVRTLRSCYWFVQVQVQVLVLYAFCLYKKV